MDDKEQGERPAPTIGSAARYGEQMTDNMELFRHAAGAMVREARASASDLPHGLPDVASTPGQTALEAKNGTPKAFAELCVQAIGDISPAEARTAVARYLEEWRAA